MPDCDNMPGTNKSPATSTSPSFRLVVEDRKEWELIRLNFDSTSNCEKDSWVLSTYFSLLSSLSLPDGARFPSLPFFALRYNFLFIILFQIEKSMFVDYWRSVFAPENVPSDITLSANTLSEEHFKEHLKNYTFGNHTYTQAIFSNNLY